MAGPPTGELSLDVASWRILSHGPKEVWGTVQTQQGLSLPPGVKYSQRGRTCLNPHLDSRARKCIPGRKYGPGQVRDAESGRSSQVAWISRRSKENSAGVWEELEKMQERKGIYPIQQPAQGHTLTDYILSYL